MLIGPPLASKYVIQFKGNPGLAKNNLTQATSTHREKTGAYKTLTCKDPTQSEIRLYINPDENPQQIRTKYETKILGKLLRPDVDPQLNDKTKMYVQQRDGRIAINFNGLVKVSAKFQSIPKLVWNRTLASEYNIDILELQERFHKALQTRTRDEGVEWSSV